MGTWGFWVPRMVPARDARGAKIGVNSVGCLQKRDLPQRVEERRRLLNKKSFSKNKWFTQRSQRSKEWFSLRETVFDYALFAPLPYKLLLVHETRTSNVENA
jgi:hypothetical protein